MKKRLCNLLKVMIVFISILSFTNCKEEDPGLPLYWEDVPRNLLNTYVASVNTPDKLLSVELDTDRTEGDIFCKYQLFDKNNTDGTLINNITFKDIGYNVCGFEGKLKYVSGPSLLYGFLLNVNLDDGTFYMLSLTQNGGFELYYYSGSATVPSKGYMTFIAKKSSADMAAIIDKDRANTIKVETVNENRIDISFNGTTVYTINNPVNKRGTVGMFQMLNTLKDTEYNKSNPMVSEFLLTKLQRY